MKLKEKAVITIVKQIIMYKLADGVNRRDIINDLFVELKIYLPDYCPINKAQKLFLGVTNASIALIKTVHFLIIDRAIFQ